MTTADAHTLTGASSLDAVTGPERERFEQHLTQCESCTLEVRKFGEVAGRLGGTLDRRPGPDLRAKVLDALEVTRQLPPVVTPLPARFPSPWRTRLAVGFAAAAVIAGVAVGGVTITTSSPGPVSTAQQHNPVDRAADAVTVTGRSTTAGTATVAISRALGKVSVSLHGVPALDNAHAYQVWLIGPRGPQAAGLLRPGAEAASLVAAAPADTDRVGMTIEPVAGSPQPTIPGVVLLDVG
jgi:hypothetical protein